MKELRTMITEFREKRGWEKYDTLERFSKSISIEAAELLEHFQWNEEGNNIQEIKDELADVLIYSLAMCYHLNEDPKKIIQDKLVDVAKRYPEK